MQAASNYLNDTLPTTGKVVAENEYKVRSDGSTMHALTWQSSNKVQVKTVGVPTITQPKDVVLKVTGSTICGSDLHLYHGECSQSATISVLAGVLNDLALCTGPS
jgi:hypothetical protein